MPYGIVVVVLILLLLFSTFRVLNEYERGVMLTLGRFTGVKGPGVVIVQIRDRMDGGWENPYEYDDLTGNATKPFFLLQHNWYKMMDYFQGDMEHYFMTGTGYPIHKITFQYIPNNEENKAALSFHLSNREKRDIEASLESPHNRESFNQVMDLVVPHNSLAGNPISKK